MKSISLNKQTIVTLARGYLPCYLALVFSGLTTGYLPEVKWTLVHADILAMAAIVLLMLYNPRAGERWRIVLPFTLWVISYYIWGWYVSPAPGDEANQVISQLFLQPTLLGSAALGIIDRRSLGRLAALLLVVAVANCLVCLLQTTHPDMIAVTLRPDVTVTPDQIENIIARPFGWWANPNEAARFFFFALMLSYWQRHPLAWVGRLAAVAGIVLTTSRFGMLLLLVNGALAIAAYLLTRPRPLTLVRRYALPALVLLCLPVFGILGRQVWGSTLHGDVMIDTQPTRWQRLLSVGDDLSSEISTSRTSLLLQGIRRFLRAPWYGEGIFTYQTPGKRMPLGVHNIYVAVFGETGVVMGVLFLFLLIFGFSRVLRASLARGDGVMLRLIWGSWLACGFISHTLLWQPVDPVIWGILWTLPAALAQRKEPTCA